MMLCALKTFVALAAFICVPAIHAAPSSNYVHDHLNLRSGRLLYQEHLPARLRFLSKEKLFASIHELTDCYLHGPLSTISLCAGTVDTHIVPHLSPTTVKIDGVALSTKIDLTISLTTYQVDSQRVTVARNAQGEPIVVWLNDDALHPLHTKDFPGVFVHSNHKRLTSIGTSDSRQVSLDDDAIPIPTVLDAHHANQSDPTPLSAIESCQKGAPPRMVEVAVAFDAEYCKIYSLNGEQASQSLRALVAEAEKAFSDDTCIRLKAVSFDGVCNPSSDPYSDISSDPLEMFRQYWISNMGSVKRDVAYFVSGAEDGTSTAGRAYLRATCNDAYGYGWTEGNSPAIFAHEMGHTLGADHAESGLMRPSLTGNDPLKFSSATLQQIISFVDDGGSSSDCLGIVSGGERPEVSPVASPSESSMPSSSAFQSIAPSASSSSAPSLYPSSSSSPSASISTSPDPSKPRRPRLSQMPSTPPPTPEVSKSPTQSLSLMQSNSPSSDPTQHPKRSAKPRTSTKPSMSAPSSSRPARPSPKMSESPEELMPSEIPSESPEMDMFETTSPIPTEVTSSSRDTCQSSLNRMGRSIPCTYWENIGSLSTRLGAVTLYLRQVNKRFRLYLKPEVDSHLGGQTNVSSYNVRFSFIFNDNGTGGYVGRAMSQSRPYAEINVHPRLLELPEGSYCCGAVLYMDVNVTLSRRIPFGDWDYEGTSDASGVYAFRVKCNPDCKKRSGLPIGDDCPVCF